MSLIITNIITTLLLISLGFLIKKYNLSFLVAGYNTSSKKEKEKYDEKKLTTYVGNLLINSSFILIIGTIFIYLIPNRGFIISNIIWVLMVLYILIGVIHMNSTDIVKKDKNNF